MDWKREWFSSLSNFHRSYWKSLENRKNFLEEIRIKLGVKNSKDWGKVTIQRFKQLGGSTLLNYYDGSLVSCLQASYPGFARD